MCAELPGLLATIKRSAFGDKGDDVELAGHKSDIVNIELSRQGILLVRWKPGAVVTETEADALKSRAVELSSGRSLPMLVEMASMKSISRAATEIFSAPWPLARMALVGSSPVDEVIASFYVSRHNHACPTQFFRSVSDAVSWLTEG